MTNNLKDSDPDALISLAEAAKLRGIDIKTLRSEIRRGGAASQKMETKMTTWLELSKASNGTHVCFPLGHDIFPDALVPEGAMGVIQENGLNEIWCTMLILPDDKNIREQLKEWDGCIV